jgi:hypothetical protein
LHLKIVIIEGVSESTVIWTLPHYGQFSSNVNHLSGSSYRAAAYLTGKAQAGPRNIELAHEYHFTQTLLLLYQKKIQHGGARALSYML